jgi:integrase
MKPQFTKGSIYKDGQYYYFKTRDSVNNKQIKKCTFETTIRKAKSASKKILAELYASAGRPVTPKSKKGSIDTVTEMIDLFYETVYLQNLKQHSAEKQKTMISGTKSRFDHLKRHIGGVDPRNLDMNVINKYIGLRRDDRKKNGAAYSDGSINFELNLLKSSIKVLPNGLKFNVKANIKDHVKLVSVEREVLLTDDQYENMLEKFAEYDRENKYTSNYSFFLEVLMFTGVRWGQLQLLEFSDINIEKSRLEFPASKVKHEKTKKHIVYIDRDILLKLKKSMNSRDIDKSECNCLKIKDCKIQKSDFVFVNKHKRCEHFHKDMFYILWNQFCEELGYVKYDKFKKDEQESIILPHDIRRTRIVKMIEMEIDRSYIMSQTGHKSHKTFDKYNLIQEDTMRTLIEEQRAKETEIRQRKVAKQNDLEKDYNNLQESIWE